MADSRETKPGRKFFTGLLPKTGDSEPEQAIKIRLTIGFFILLYFGVPWGSDEQVLTTLLSTPSLITMVYYAAAISIVVAIYLNPRPSPIRRIVGIVIDLASLSLLMFHSGDESVFLYVLYLWVILGNGFRYGANYLYISLAVGMVGFTIAVVAGPYWQDIHHKPIGYSLILLLLLVPLYSAFLINKLHAAIRTAKLANEAKSRFLANMSHELRTPLNGVIGIADLLGETSLSRQQHEFVNIMRNSANTLLGLIENVLDISKIEAGKIHISKEAFDLHSLINNIIQLQIAMGHSKGLRVSHCIDSRVDFNLIGDPQHLRQVLINLLGNAIKFTDNGTVRLLIKPVKPATIADPVRIRFEVQDTGIGISEEYLEKIFEDFTQANNAGAVKYQGTGLGTTISKQLVELMGGEIGVESELGAGTTFWFEIPFETDSNQTLQLSDQKVLLFTNDDTAGAIRRSLDGWEIPHHSVTSSAQAMTALMKAIEEQNPFSTLIIEQQAMSGISPVQYAQMLSQESQLEDLSLILVTPQDELLDSEELNQFYLSAIDDVGDTRTLFNALHAVEASHLANSGKVVSLHDFYHAQAKNERQLTILVAEDNKVNQKVLEGMLNNLGHRILLASTGEEAMDLVSEKHEDIDLMILDMNMPEYSGTEIIQAVSFLNTARHIPSIMLTADATPEAQQRSKEAGADLFLTKPINSKELLSHIAAISQQLPIDTEQTEVSTETIAADGLINHDHLQALEALGGGEEFMTQLIDSFQEDGRKHVAIINQSVADDYYQYRESLHALKGTSTEIGAQKLADLCRHAEKLQPNQLNSQEMTSLVEEINAVFETTLNSLRSALQNLSSQTSH